jgi:hypothetical protein
MCSNPYLNIFNLYSGFEGSKQIVTLWGCLCEQTVLQCSLPICTACLDCSEVQGLSFMTLIDQAMMEKLCVGCIVNVATGKLFLHDFDQWSSTS